MNELGLTLRVVGQASVSIALGLLVLWGLAGFAQLLWLTATEALPGSVGEIWQIWNR